MIAFASQDLGLSLAQWKAIERKARLTGKTTLEYLRLLIEQDLLAAKTFDDMLRPIRGDFKKARITTSTLDEIVSRAHHGGAKARLGKTRLKPNTRGR